MYITISTTSDCKKTLKKITLEILDAKLSPCIQRYKKIKSYYVWKEEIKNHDEYKIEIKALSKDKNKIINHIKKLHNYENPEIVSSSIDILSKEYEKWFKSSIKK